MGGGTSLNIKASAATTWAKESHTSDTCEPPVYCSFGYSHGIPKKVSSSMHGRDPEEFDCSVCHNNTATYFVDAVCDKCDFRLSTYDYAYGDEKAMFTVCFSSSCWNVVKDAYSPDYTEEEIVRKYGVLKAARVHDLDGWHHCTDFGAVQCEHGETSSHYVGTCTHGYNTYHGICTTHNWIGTNFACPGPTYTVACDKAIECKYVDTYTCTKNHSGTCKYDNGTITDDWEVHWSRACMPGCPEDQDSVQVWDGCCVGWNTGAIECPSCRAVFEVGTEVCQFCHKVSQFDGQKRDFRGIDVNNDAIMDITYKDIGSHAAPCCEHYYENYRGDRAYYTRDHSQTDYYTCSSSYPCQNGHTSLSTVKHYYCAEHGYAGTTPECPGLSLFPSPRNMSVYVGQSSTITPNQQPTSASVSYTSSNSNIASVSSTGRVTGKKKGSATITVKATL